MYMYMYMYMTNVMASLDSPRARVNKNGLARIKNLRTFLGCARAPAFFGARSYCSTSANNLQDQGKHCVKSAENNKKRGKSRILLKIAGLGENREICCIRGIAISWRDRLVHSRHVCFIKTLLIRRTAYQYLSVLMTKFSA